MDQHYSWNMLTLITTGLIFRNTESFHDPTVAGSPYQELYPTDKTLLYSEFIPSEIPLVWRPKFPACPLPCDALTTAKLLVLSQAN